MVRILVIAVFVVLMVPFIYRILKRTCSRVTSELSDDTNEDVLIDIQEKKNNLRASIKEDDRALKDKQKKLNKIKKQMED